MEHEEKWKTRCHYTPTHEDTAHTSVGCLVSSKNAFFCYVPEDIAALAFPSSLWMESLNVHSFLPSVVHFDFEKTISLTQWILLFSFTPCHSLPSHPLLSLLVLQSSIRQYCASQQKGQWCLWTREEVIIFNRQISPRGWPPAPFLFPSDPFVVLSDAPNLMQAPCRKSDALVKQ